MPGPSHRPLKLALAFGVAAVLLWVQAWILLHVPNIWPGVGGRIVPVVTAFVALFGLLALTRWARRKPDSSQS